MFMLGSMTFCAVLTGYTVSADIISVLANTQWSEHFSLCCMVYVA